MPGPHRVGAVLAASLAVTALSGCGNSGITRDRIQRAFGPTFARLYVAQQHAHGRTVQAKALDPRTTCRRGAPADRTDAAATGSGAGEDWSCLVTYLVDGPGTPSAARYTLSVKTSGCFTADGDGPLEVNGEQTLVTPAGDTVTNPLWSFDGCFDDT